MKKTFSNILTSTEKSKDNGLFTFKNLSQKFFWALRWNGIESIIYQSIFMIHQWYMFSLIDKQVYGIMGTFFACTYLGVTLLMGALDTALMPWIVEYTQNKKSFITCIKYYVIPQCLVYLSAPLLLWLLFKSPWIPVNFLILKSHLFLMGIFLGCEGIKKLLRHLLQLAFLNRATALLEIFGIASYCAIVWVRYIYGHPFSIEGLIVPFIITSTTTIGFCCYRMYTFYQTLPVMSVEHLHLPTWKKVGYVRIISSINQIVRSLFSTNVLIPLSSAFFGFAQTSVISFVNYISHTLTFFIYKVCAPAAAAFFGHATVYDKSHQKKAFIITLKAATAVIALALAISSIVGIYSSTFLTPECIMLLAALLAIHTIENIFIMYEKFLIISNQSELLAVLNSAHLCISYVLITSTFPITLSACLCFILRLVVLGIASFVVFRTKT